MPTAYIDPWVYDEASTPGKGDVPAEYALIGIAPSPSRPYVRRNEPFGAKSWGILNAILSSIPGQRTAYVTNLVKTPLKSGARVKKAAKELALRQLEQELAIVKPRRVLAIGSPVAEALCPEDFQNMADDHGSLFISRRLSDKLGYPLVVVPTYHFSAIGRDVTLRPRLARDLWRYFHLPHPTEPEYVVLRDRAPKFRPGANVYLDLETTGFDPHKGEIIWCGIGTDYTDKVALLDHPTPDMLRELLHNLISERCTLIGQNLQFDLYWLVTKTGLADWADVPVRDTMLIAHNQGEPSVGLKHLSTMLTNRPGPHTFGTFSDPGYAAEDVHATREVYQQLVQRRDLQTIDGLMHRAIPELVQMRSDGVFIHRPLLQTLAADFRVQLTDIKRKLAETWNVPETFNWRQGDEVAELFLRSGVKLKEKTKTGKWKLTEAVLLGLGATDNRIQALLDYRAAEKTLTGFFEGYLEMTAPDHPYLHPLQDLKGAQTGRTSMRNPNLQQVTRTGPSKLIFRSQWFTAETNGDTKSAREWIAELGADNFWRGVTDGYLTCSGKYGLIDLEQAELRAVALLSGDKTLADSLLTSDPHRANAARVYKMKPEDVPAALRKRVKGIVFGLLYGGTAIGLAKRVGVSVAEVNKVLVEFFGAFPQLAAWLEHVKAAAVDSLMTEDTFGRRRSLEKLAVMEGLNSVERKGANTPVQALASHMAISILADTSSGLRRRHMLSRTLFGIHDSTLLDIHPDDDEKTIAGVVQDAFYGLNFTPLRDLSLWTKLPITGELVVGKSWAAIESTSDYYEGDKNRSYKCSTHRQPVSVGLEMVSLG